MVKLYSSFLLVYLFLASCTQTPKKNLVAVDLTRVLFEKKNTIQFNQDIDGVPYFVTARIRGPYLNSAKGDSLDCPYWKKVCVHLTLSGEKAFQEFKELKYSLFINGQFQKQLAVEPMKEWPPKGKVKHYLYLTMVCGAETFDNKPQSLDFRVLDKNKKQIVLVKWKAS